MFTESKIDRPKSTLRQIRKFAHTAWGELGERVVDCWQEYNLEHFSGKLEPVPLVLTRVSPYGHWTGLTTGGRGKRVASITLTMPADGDYLIANRNVLLHEMVHQYLIEGGENPSHDSQPWCDEIMRLSEAFGKQVWAAPDKVGKHKKTRKSFRYKPDSDDGKKSMTQEQIAHWPHGVLKLGNL